MCAMQCNSNRCIMTVQGQFRGHSRSSKVTSFDRLPVVSYHRPIVTLSLKCTVFEIMVENRRKKTTPFGTLIWHVPWGDLLRIFRRVIPCQKLESWSYQMVYISWSYFRSAGHNTACDGQTDNRQTDTATLRCRKDRAMQSVARVKIKDTSKPNAFTVKLKRNSPIIWLLQGAVTVSVANKTVQISATPCLKNCKNIFVRTL